MAEDYLKIKKNTMTLKYLMTKLFHEQFLRLILIICKLIKFLQKITTCLFLLLTFKLTSGDIDYESLFIQI